MRNLFNKENFLFPTFDKKQKKQAWILFGLIALLFVASTFTFVNMLYAFTDVVGSIVSGSIDVAIKDLFRSLPLFLVFFMTLWTLLALHAFFRNVSEEKRLKSMKKCAITVLAFAGVNFFYVSIRRFSGGYSSFAEGSPSPWFPLDTILYSLPFIAVAAVALLDGKKILKAYPYVVPSRGPVVKKARFVYCFFLSIWMLFAIYGFAAFWLGLFCIDFIHGHLPYALALVLVFFVNAIFFIAWEFYYNEVKAEKRKDVLLPLSFVGLGVSLVTAIFFFVALGTDKFAPSNIGFGLQPIAFAASINIATILLVLVPVIVSIVALIKGLILRKKKPEVVELKKEEPAPEVAPEEPKPEAAPEK